MSIRVIRGRKGRDSKYRLRVAGEQSRREFLRDASLSIAGVAAGATIPGMIASKARAADPDNPAYSYGGIRGRRSDGKEIAAEEIDQFAAEMDNFAQCILTNTASKVSGEEGLRDIRILMAVFESIKTGQPVKLA